MISRLLLVFNPTSLHFFIYLMLIVHIPSLGYIIGPFVVSYYLVVFMKAWIIINPLMAN